MFAQFAAVLTVLAVIQTGESAECPGGWTHYGASCLVVLMDPVHWYEAKVACATVGGQLVEIANADENNFVTNLLKTHRASYTWIGLEDFLVEGKFVLSSTGSPPAYTNFHAGEPDDHHGADCATIRDSGEWYDDQCHSTHPAVCQRVVGQPAHTYTNQPTTPELPIRRLSPRSSNSQQRMSVPIQHQRTWEEEMRSLDSVMTTDRKHVFTTTYISLSWDLF